MRARLLFAGFFLLITIPVLLMPADTSALEGLAARHLFQDMAAVDSLVVPNNTSQLRLMLPRETQASDAYEDALRGSLKLPASHPILRESGGLLVVHLPDAPTGGRVITRHIAADHGSKTIKISDEFGKTLASTRLASRTSLLPALLAILLAFLLRSTLISLSIGVIAGTILVVQSSHHTAFGYLFGHILGDKIFGDSFHLYILGFVFILSSMVALITRMGGIEGMVLSMTGMARNSRSVQAVAYALGLSIFFDDYANTIVVGNSCRPLFDRLKVSRAKLAYIVDSTAAPVAGVAVLSTWVAYQISTFAPQLPTIGLEESMGYSIFLETIPYRFYCLLAIVMVGLVIWTRRDFGPMLEAERQAAAAPTHSPNETPLDKSAVTQTTITMAEWVTPRSFNGWLPLVTMISMTAFLLFYSGAEAMTSSALAEAKAAGTTSYLRELLAHADSSESIFFGSLASLVLALLMSLGQRLIPLSDALITTTRGMGTLIKDGVMVLVLAWSIGEVCQSLGTADWLVASLQNSMAPQWLPLALFATSCFVAFATGSSWTTMAIMQPNVVLLAHRLGSQLPADSPIDSHLLLILSIGAVLEGSIFGDHCSPISDTTVLSSTASACKHIVHVRTQAPYALLVVGIALLVGYLPTVLLGPHPAISLGIGAVLLFAFLRLVGKQTHASAIH
ncbi:MAG: Na+/H+ antiporter NhaC family protein [Planctomycetes bacterium]|nr:Na+/H+ antiporter NhaC family protein [Planctomycetota bacterium]